MGILRADRITGLGGANAIKGSVKFTSGGALDIDLDGTSIGTSNFTIEAWVFWFGNGFHQFTGSSSNNFNFYIADDDGDLKFYDGSNTYDLDASPVRANEWTHVALVREGTSTSQTKVYVNGVNTQSVTINTSFSFDRLLSGINYLDGSRGYGNGYTSNLRFTLDTVYTSAFTPPSHELTILDNTIVLCCQSPGNVLQEATGKKVVVFKHGVNQGDPVASHFTPNSPVGFSTTTDVGSQYGSTFDGFGSFATSTYMVPPGGNTRERNRGRALIMAGASSPGANNQSAIQYFNISTLGNAQFFGNLTVARRALQGLSSSTRGLALGGFISSPATISDTIDFVTFASTGNGTDFGNLTSTAYAAATASNDTRGLFAGGYRPNNSAVVDSIDYVTIATAGNAADFGDLLSAKRANAGGSNTTRAVFAGGTYPAVTDVIQYVTIATTGNATDFGDLTVARDYPAGGGSSSTRTCFAGGRTPSNTNVIDFITTATTGNATDFGDSQSGGIKHGLVSNLTRGVICSDASITNTLEYITFATTGDALDFGDQGESGNNTFPTVYSPGACSDSHGGLS